MIPLILIILVLLVLGWQDIRSRSVWVFLFPLLFVFSLWYKWDTLQLSQCLWNLGFLVFSFLGLTFYLTIKERQLVAIWKGYFSWGDILYLLSIVPLLNFSSYLIYFTFGTIVTLLIHTTVLLTQRKATKTIPYAGYMALVLVVYLYVESTLLNEFTLLTID